MVVDGQNLRLRMEAVDGGSSVSAGDKAQAAVLDELETADGGGRVVGKDYGGGVVVKRSDQYLEGGCQTLLIVAEGSVGEGPKDVEASASLL